MGLLIVARTFPAPAGSSITRAQASGGAGPVVEAEGLARRDGVWEGTRRVYSLQGVLRSEAAVRLEITSVSAEAQTIVSSETVTGREPLRRRGSISGSGGVLEMRLWDAAGATATWTGREHGRSILWHRRDDRAGMEESLHEEVVRQADGDVYLVHGWITGSERLFVEGRYRRSEQDEP